MNKQEIADALFKIFAIGAFLFQMQNSIRKYVDGPIVQQKSSTRYDDIEKPIIYICQVSQFNYTSAVKQGYRGLTRFLLGENLNMTTWNGRYQNETFDELKTDLYEFNYSTTNINVKHGSFVKKNIEEVAERKFITPDGFCSLLKMKQKHLNIETNERLRLYLIDPTNENRLKIIKSRSGEIEFGSLHNGFYEAYSLKIKISLHDHEIMDGITCRKFDKSHKYGDCLEMEVEKSMLDWFGCLLPWFPSPANLSCEGKPNIKMHNEIFQQFQNFLFGWNMKALAPCSRPCGTMSFESTVLGHVTQRIDLGYVEFVFEDEVNVYTDVYAYDMFSLIVDLGSALGKDI